MRGRTAYANKSGVQRGYRFPPRDLGEVLNTDLAQRQGETHLRDSSLLSALSVLYIPYAALPHARHIDGAREALQPLDVHPILFRKLSEDSSVVPRRRRRQQAIAATRSTKYVLALLKERDKGRDEEVVARNVLAGRLVLRSRARLEELFEASLLTCAKQKRLTFSVKHNEL